MTSNEPYYKTPDIQAKLRRINKIMRAGRMEETIVMEDFYRSGYYALQALAAEAGGQNYTVPPHLSPAFSVRDKKAI